MFEILFALMFVGILMFTGVTMVTFFIALVAALFIGFLLSMLGAVIKLLPWIILALVALQIYKHYNKPKFF
ncbi:MAG: envelope stress response protein PspG [Vibrio sp.]